MAANTNLYRQGTVNVTNGSKIVTGSNCYWLTAVNRPMPGDLWGVDGVGLNEIISVDSDNQLTLYSDYSGLTRTNADYAIIRHASTNTNSRIASEVTARLKQHQELIDGFELVIRGTGQVLVKDSLGAEHPLDSFIEMNRKVDDAVDTANNLTGSILAMTKSEFEALRQIRRDNNAGSGWVRGNEDFERSFQFGNTAGWENKLKVLANHVEIDGVYIDIPDTNIILPAPPDGLDRLDLSGRFASLADAIVAGGTSLSQSYLNGRLVIIPAHSLVLTTDHSTAYIQDPKNNVFGDNGTLFEYHFEWIINRIPVGVDTINYAEVLIALGWSKVGSDPSLFEKDNYQATTGVIVQQYNLGGHHEVLNKFGTKKFMDNQGNPKFWYDADAKVPSTLAECFDVAFVSSSNASGHFAGFLPKMLYSHQVNDCRLRKLNSDLSESKALQYCTHGLLRGWAGETLLIFTEGKNKTITIGEGSVGAGGYYVKIPISAADNGLGVLKTEFEGVNARSYILHGNNGKVVRVDRGNITVDYVRWPNSENYAYIYNAKNNTAIASKIMASFPVGTIVSIAAEVESDVKFSHSHCGDYIGYIPDLYELNDGKPLHGGLINSIPDGDAKKYTARRPIQSWISRNYTVDKGGTWGGDTATGEHWESTSSRFYSIPDGAIHVQHYKTPAFAFTPSMRQPIADRISLIWASNSASIGAVLSNNLTSATPTNNTLPTIVERPFLSYVITQVGLDNAAGHAPMHEGIEFGGTSDGVKIAAHFYNNNGYRYLVLLYKQIRFDTLTNSFGDKDENGFGFLSQADYIQTMPDENGLSVEVGCFVSKKPLGFTHKGQKHA